MGQLSKIAISSGGGTLKKIETGSYVGTGDFGSASLCSLTFKDTPSIVIIFGSSGEVMMIPHFLGKESDFVYSRGNTTEYGFNRITWEGNTVSWYCSDAGNGVGSITIKARHQMNENGTEYHWLAF